jgi:cytochrome oxidase assembly protein ShyY1
MLAVWQHHLAAYRGDVLRTALWTLRQPRYMALAAFMLLVAMACSGAGTWQVFRYQQKVHENEVLTANAHAAAVPLTTSLVPMVGDGPAPGRYAIGYRTVRVTGTYLDRAPQYLRNQTQDGNNGFYVLSPLHTGSGVLLVVRGFVGDRGDSTVPATAPAPPAGRVTLTGRLSSADTASDAADALPNHELESINPAEQSARLGLPAYAAYLTLDAHQPGTAGIKAIPGPDLSNPAGGAYSWQNLAYVFQWYLFALLALAAPFVVARSEIRDARRRYLGVDVGDIEFDQPPELGGPAPPELPPAQPDGQLVRRPDATLATLGEQATVRWERANKLADRYGRSLGPGVTPEDLPELRHPAATPAAGPGSTYRSSDDVYRAGYNDYLWELALADAADEADGAGRSAGERRARDRNPQLPAPDPATQAPTTIRDTAPPRPDESGS